MFLSAETCPTPPSQAVLDRACLIYDSVEISIQEEISNSAEISIQKEISNSKETSMTMVSCQMSAFHQKPNLEFMP